MTETVIPEVNGSAPAQEEAPGEPAPAGERIVGIIGLAFALGLAAIAVDLLTGGAVSRLASSMFGGGDDES